MQAIGAKGSFPNYRKL